MNEKINQAVKKAYYVFRHYGGINLATHWLAGRRLCPFILCYHQVDQREFRAHVRFLKRRFAIVSLNELEQRLRAGRRETVCALTLDDCIREDVEKAMEVITAEQACITFYLSTAYALEEQSMWANKIIEVVSRKEVVSFCSKNWVTRTIAQKATVKDLIIGHFLSLGLQTTKLENRVDDWLRENGIRKLRDGLRVISVEMVKRYAESPFVQFESHTCSHPFLKLCPEDEIRQELTESKRIIESITGKTVTSLCYPYGSAEVIGNHAPESARQIYSNATTLINGVCGINADPFLLPRIGIYTGEGIKELAGKIYHFQNLQLWAERATRGNVPKMALYQRTES